MKSVKALVALVIVSDDGEPRACTEVIAQGVRIRHKNVMELVRRYVLELLEFGTFAFETRKSGGRPTEFAMLNDEQRLADLQPGLFLN